jgi:Zn-dependent M16 (insulinase) family peptidase
MQIIDNINKTVKDDLQVGIHKGSKMSVAAACFSIYAYQELKKQLDGIDELRFIFTSPTFVTEKASKAQRMEMNAELKKLRIELRQMT